MTRTTPLRPLAALGLCAALLAYVGCTKPSDSNAGAGATRGGATTAPPSGATPAAPADGSGPGAKLFADWPTPAGALLISGEMDGYLEPCGCTAGQLGGLRRRSDLIDRLRGQDWPLTLIDLGSLIKDPAANRGGVEEVKIKFGIALKALAMLKYDALALSVEDLKLGVDEALGQFLNIGDRPKVVAANVVASAGLEKTFVPSLKTASGPIKIGITAVLDPERLKALADASKDAVFPTVQTPDEALPAILADLEKDTHVQVLMVQGAPEEAKRLAEKFPGFTVVVATSHFADPPQEPEFLNDGRTMLVTVGQKGKYVGVVGLFQDPKKKFRYQRVTLGHRYDGPAKALRDLIEVEFQDLLRQARVVENYPRHDYVHGALGATFVGVESCRSCHPNTVAKWSGTKHAHAFEDIVRDPKGLRSDHQFDAECVSCHTTGFEYNSGWRSAEATPALKGNQCENCHGPASKHSADPDNADYRKALARTSADADKTRMCIRCHDEDNSPKFDFVTYWGQVAHSKLDTYTDPKVHEGQVPNVARSEPKP